jgi:hypothetical protein
MFLSMTKDRDPSHTVISGTVPTPGVLHPHGCCMIGAAKGAVLKWKLEFLEVATRARPKASLGTFPPQKRGRGHVLFTNFCSSHKAHSANFRFTEFSEVRPWKARVG